MKHHLPEMPFEDADSITDPDPCVSPDMCDLCEGCLTLCRYEPFPNELDFYCLLEAMVHEINSLEEELVRTRQALLKHLPKELSEGLYDDIFCNLSASFYGNYKAYDDFVSYCHDGKDPMESREHVKTMLRLRDGTDETTYHHL